MSIKLPFLNRKKKKTAKTQSEVQANVDNKPNHVAIIMDGNGRWAKKRDLPRNQGHQKGMHVVRDIVIAAHNENVKVLTLYAFSTENWKREQSEVEFLMNLPKRFLHTYLPELIENNVKVETIGHFDGLPRLTKEAINHAKAKTKDNDGLLLNFAINYGSRFEIIHAVKHILADIDQSKLTVDALNEEVFANYLYTEGLSDPDLLIRTSGEKRLSNFLLWQLAYTEFWFTDVLWPDFTEDVFKLALDDYKQRKRRYGGV